MSQLSAWETFPTFCLVLCPDLLVSLSCPAPTQILRLSQPLPALPASGLPPMLSCPGSLCLSPAWDWRCVRGLGNMAGLWGGTVGIPAEAKTPSGQEYDLHTLQDLNPKLPLAVSEPSRQHLSFQGPLASFLPLYSFNVQTPSPCPPQDPEI